MWMVKEHQFVNKKLVSRTGNNLGKYIGKLKLQGNVGKRDNTSIKSLTNGMTIHFNMFSAIMEDGIGCNLNGISIINIERCSRVLREARH